MSIFRRSRPRTDPVRAAGLQAAVGLIGRRRLRRTGTEPLGITCGTCGTMGRIDMVDMTERRAYLTCPSCERTWDTDRDAVPRRPFALYALRSR